MTENKAGVTSCVLNLWFQFELCSATNGKCLWKVNTPGVLISESIPTIAMARVTERNSEQDKRTAKILGTLHET